MPIANEEVGHLERHHHQTTANFDVKASRIIFFSDCKLQGDPSSEQCSRVQQYDVSSKSWLLSQIIPVKGISDFAVCEDGENIRMIGGDLGVTSVHLKYNLQKNTIEFVGFTNFNTRQGAKLAKFKGKFYLTGGKIHEKRSRSVHYSFTESEWRVADLLSVARSHHVVLTTSYYIYVIGGTTDRKLHIECNSFRDGETTRWDELKNPLMSPSLNSANFFVKKNELHCLYSKDEDIIHGTYSHRSGLWDYVRWQYEGRVIERVCQFSYFQSKIYFTAQVTATYRRKSSYIPNYCMYGKNHLENDESDHREDRGKLEISLTDNVKVLYSNTGCVIHH